MDEISEDTQELKHPFYEELRNSGIFRSKNMRNGNEKEGDSKRNAHSEIDIQKLMQQEDYFEIKLNSSVMTIQEYYDYIRFKKDLCAKVGVRGKGNPRAQYFQHIIKAHIKKLYTEAISRFPRDLTLWSDYIRFCKIAKFYSEGSAAYKQILTFHDDDPEYWLAATQWEYDFAKNIKEAQNILHTAIAKHPDQPALYIKMFKILLSLAESEESADYRLALAVYENYAKRNFAVDYWAKALEIAEEYPFAKKLQTLLLGYIVENYVHTELIWDLLAQREFKGLPNGQIIKERLDPEGLQLPNSETDTPMDMERNANYRRKNRLQLCAAIYQAGCRIINTEQMWTYYINAMLKLNKDIKSGTVLKRGHLVAAFSGALEAKRLSEDYFRDYLELLRESAASDETILDVLNRGPALYPGSALPWELLLHHYMIKDQEKEINDIFEKACRELREPERTFPLWQLMIRYYQTVPAKYDYVYGIFEKACNEPSPKFLPLRILYLEFCVVNQPMEYVRKVYDKLTKISPPYLPLHKRMALLESAQLTPDLPNWRKCHRNAVDFFGEQQADVWIDYMNFEKCRGDPSKISQIYEEATNVLEGEPEKKFVSDYTILTAIKRNELTEDD